MKRVAMIGVGLIGGSLALSFRQHEHVHIVGYDQGDEILTKAVELGMIDEGTTDLTSAVLDADFIFLCVPVSLIRELMEKLAVIPLKPGCIITDVGSTKAGIVKASQILKGQPVTFIGGHPMAGSHKSGVTAAHSILFENAYYVLTPTEDTPDEAIQKLEELLRSTKANLLVIDPLRHDQIVGAISHLPHIVAALLVNQVAGYSSEEDLYSRLAAGGFRDITRIASSHPRMWRDILLENRQHLLPLLEDWKDRMEEVIQWIDGGRADSIERFFAEAKTFRNELPERKKGPISGIYDLYVAVPDHPGTIARITALLAQESINLANIQIIESREDAPGALRLTFRAEIDVDKASIKLSQEGYLISRKD
jgi:prephenate dehydrogenase